MAAPLFWFELAFLVATLLILWPLAIGQILVYRFTPRRKWVDLKVNLVFIAVWGLCIQTARCPDSSAGFGLMSSMTQRLLWEQLGACFLYGLLLVMLQQAKSLSTQLGRSKVPWGFSRALWAIVISNHACSIPILIGTVYARTTGNQHLEMWWFCANAFLFQVVSMVLLAIYWSLFLELRKMVATFLTTLKQQERSKIAAAATTMTATTAAAAAPAAMVATTAITPSHLRPCPSPSPPPCPSPPSMMMVEDRTLSPASVAVVSVGAMDAAATAAALPPQPQPRSSPSSHHHAHESSVSAAGALTRNRTMSAITHHQHPQHHPQHDASSPNLNRTHTHTHTQAAGSGALMTTRDSQIRVTRIRSSSVQSSADATATVTVTSGSSGTTEAPVTPGRARVVTISPAPTATTTATAVAFAARSPTPTSPLGPQPPLPLPQRGPSKVRLTQVAPSPSPSPILGSNLGVTFADGGAVAAVTATPLGPQILGATATATVTVVTAVTDQSDDRVRELHRALHKLLLLTLLVNTLLIGTSLSWVPNQFLFLREGGHMTIREVVSNPSGQGDAFPLLGGAATAINQLSIATIIWYAWSSMKVWTNTLGTSAFWITLRHGVSNENNEAAAGSGGAAGGMAGGGLSVNNNNQQQQPPQRYGSMPSRSGGVVGHLRAVSIAPIASLATVGHAGGSERRLLPQPSPQPLSSSSQPIIMPPLNPRQPNASPSSYRQPQQPQPLPPRHTPHHVSIAPSVSEVETMIFSVASGGGSPRMPVLEEQQMEHGGEPLPTAATATTTTTTSTGTAATTKRDLSPTRPLLEPSPSHTSIAPLAPTAARQLAW